MDLGAYANVERLEEVARENGIVVPQYQCKFEKSIPRSTWEKLQEQAKTLLSEEKYATPDVIAHWESIANGVVPFGYTVRED